MKRYIYVIFLFVVLTPAYATIQIPDQVIYEGSSYETFDDPLATYIDINKVEIYKITKTLCSANWRGYVSKWVIRDRALYLEKLYSNACANKNEVELARIFPDSNSMVKAIWFSGEVRLFSKGKIYNGEKPSLVLKIKNGQILD